MRAFAVKKFGEAPAVRGYAVQMAYARGAHVIATVRCDANKARQLGAEEVFDASAGDVIDQIRARYSGGVDAILDLVTGKGRDTARRRHS